MVSTGETGTDAAHSECSVAAPSTSQPDDRIARRMLEKCTLFNSIRIHVHFDRQFENYFSADDDELKIVTRVERENKINKNYVLSIQAATKIEFLRNVSVFCHFFKGENWLKCLWAIRRFLKPENKSPKTVWAHFFKPNHWLMTQPVVCSSKSIRFYKRTIRFALPFPPPL